MIPYTSQGRTIDRAGDYTPQPRLKRDDLTPAQIAARQNVIASIENMRLLALAVFHAKRQQAGRGNR